MTERTSLDKGRVLKALDISEFYQSLIPSLKINGKAEALGLCPFHNDHNPSLSVNIETGFYKCHACGAGGDPFRFYQDFKKVDFKTALKEIAKMQGIDESKHSIFATYDYRDETGNLLFQVVRMEPKTFRQRKPDGKGGWIWNTEGVRLVPYCLPEVIKAEVVFIVEGEKDVETLRNMGLTGTTNPRGSGKWRPEFNKYFKDKEVIILPDNDDPGRRHAKDVADSLHGIARSIKIIGLPGIPEKGDVTDWLQIAGNDKTRLLYIVKETLIWTPESTQETKPIAGIIRLEDVLPETVTWLWGGYIPLGKVTLLDGDPGLGKSTIALDIAARVSRGASMPDGTPGVAGGVVLLSMEDGLADTIRPRLEAMGADLSKIVALQGIPTEDGKLRFPTIEDTEAIVRACRAVNAKLVIIDPLMGYLSNLTNSHRDQDVRQALGPIVRLAEELGIAVVVIRHLNKSGGAQSIYRGGGSIGIIGAARCALLVAKDPNDENKRVLAGIKNNLSPIPTSLSFHIKGVDGASQIVWDGVSTYTADGLLTIPVSQEERSALEEAEEFLKDILAAGPVRSKEAQRQAKEMGLAETTLRRAKKALGVKASKEEYQGKWVWSFKDGQDTSKVVNKNNDHLWGGLATFDKNDAPILEGD